MNWLGFKHYRGIFLKYYNNLHNCSLTYACKKSFHKFVVFVFLHNAIDGQEALVVFVWWKTIKVTNKLLRCFKDFIFNWQKKFKQTNIKSIIM